MYSIIQVIFTQIVVVFPYHNRMYLQSQLQLKRLMFFHTYIKHNL